ncbi:zinc metalloprotease [Leuconostoc litchii]|uniref:Zinc metalloprotease n=1 Tax=Leuconostoc litchii TaxID=1981069 RepID=A0A6P2CMU1_9LACO|nr:RIP metalloprotease RseP [Leuconostoc litchii]TYC47250.1 RIP metalloprotease RseP [Leuconostoc litchii]GMA69235.1 zinc metalloprotease [Leuconostoc litchii]
MNITSIIAFLFVFGVIVTVHEFGHFIVAKKSGVLVREFAIGMGPKLLSWNRNHTAYTIRILPVGGYVRMAGMDEEPDLDAGQRLRLTLDAQGKVTKLDTRVDEAGIGLPFQVDSFDLTDALTLTGYLNNESEMTIISVHHDATIIEENGVEVQVAPRDVWLQSTVVWKRILINIAGPIMNFLLALIVFSGLGLTISSVSLNEPVVGTVQKNMPAERAGLKSGDKITAINGVTTGTWNKVANEISSSNEKQLIVSILRDGNKKQVEVTPKTVKINGVKTNQIGIVELTHTDILSRLKYGLINTGATVGRIWYALTHLFTGGFSLDKLGGPVSIAKTTSSVAKTGFLNILVFMAMLSVNLGIMNLIPIPALDGGKIILNLLEAILRRPLPQSFESGVTVVGAVFMIILMIAVTVNDILR